MNLFAELDEEREADFRKWARDNYKPGGEFSGLWHPVIQEECVKMNRETYGSGKLEPVVEPK